MSVGPLSRQQLDQYDAAGFLFRSSLFDFEEIDLLRRAAKEDRELEQRSFDRDDDGGGTVRLSVWNHPGDGIYGMFARCRRVVDAAEQILGDEAYHYHSKMIMKDARVGGAWVWHQDYGYWYGNGVLSPNLVSCYIAVDRATVENGCLQVVPGAHKLGRIDHVLTGEQSGADTERMAAILERFEIEHVEMEPGDALFFHANLPHRSDQNRSDAPRWSMICCYNAKSNDPYRDSHHPRYTPLAKVSDSAIKEVGIRRFADDASDVAWLASGDDRST